MILYYTFYYVYYDITSSSSPPTNFHFKIPGNKFLLIEYFDEIVRLIHHLLHVSFLGKNRGENVKNEFSMTFDIPIFYTRLIDFEFHPYM